MSFLFVAGGSAGANEAKLVAALELFDAAALWTDSAAPGSAYVRAMGGVYRWNQPVRAFIGPSTTSSVRGTAEEALREVAEISGVAVEFVDSAEAANLKFNFIQEYQAPLNMQGAGCVTQSLKPGWAFSDIAIHVRINQPTCIQHEVMHAFGFHGHPHQLDTILSYTRRGNRVFGYTELDRMVLRAMYRGKITPGMYHLPALVAASRYFAEELGIQAPQVAERHVASPYLDKAVERLRAEAAEKKQPYIQAQLGNAYFYSHYVARDPAEAVRFWRLAADQKNTEALYRLGTAEMAGEGTASDPASGRARLRAASDLGHAQAALAFAKALRDGVGGQADAIEAFAYFDLASRRKVSAAAGERDKLVVGLSAEQRTLADARARELPTTPQR
ncbi:MAG: hypothetical protein HY059_14715 [Proteobacteria bacterium]|nr:hypothetical protein [Pseudomonadota bacterium]